MYKQLFKPFLEKLDHESAKNSVINIVHFLESNALGLKVLEYFGTYKGKRFTHSKLQTTIAGISFDNPLLLAAGWDKEGRAIRGIYQLGFGGIEVGTVTAYPQPGNVRPRLHLLDNDVALNHFGFNGPGMEIVAQNLKRYKNSGIPIGVNIGKNKYIPTDGTPYMHAVVVRRLYEYASYFSISISSPNTPGIKELQEKKYLKRNIQEINKMMDEIGRRKPLFIKIAPEITGRALDDIIEVILDEKIAGIITTNTYAQKNLIAKYGQVWEERQGGLSGNDKKYRTIATRRVAEIYTKTQGKMLIIGVGGIYDVATALERIRAGATLIQLFTGFFSEGPSLPGKINQGIVEYMEKEHIKNLEEIRGIDAKNILENKDGYSFSIHHGDNSLEQLKKEYMQAVFQQNNLDTLLINKNLYPLKNGELGRKWSHIYLNHRIPLFQNSEYRTLFARILNRIIEEQLTNGKNYTIVSIPSSGSSELAGAIQSFSNKNIQKAIILPKYLLQVEKGTKTSFYGNSENKIHIMADDVFTSGKTMLESFQILSKNHIKNIYGVSLVARNTETVDKFNRQTSSQITSFLTLDEILHYHWNNFSSQQKHIIQKERIALS